MSSIPGLPAGFGPADVKKLVELEIANYFGRAARPELMTAADISKELRIEISACRRRLSSGEFGAVVRIGRRVFVKSKDFLDALDGHSDESMRNRSEPSRPESTRTRASRRANS